MMFHAVLVILFFFNDTATTEIYTLSLHDALPIWPLRILEPAPQRVVPPCPYFGRCGGCQLQHLSSAHQASWKKEMLRETLRRIGKIPWDREVELHAGPPWNYRNQARLKVARQADGRVVV